MLPFTLLQPSEPRLTLHIHISGAWFAHESLAPVIELGQLASLQNEFRYFYRAKKGNFVVFDSGNIEMFTEQLFYKFDS